MASFGTGNPFTEDFRLYRGIPADLAGGASIAANNVLVTASRSDPWIRAASTATTGTFVPAFTRDAGLVTFDFILCSGNGSPVPLDCVEMIFTHGPSSPTGTTIASTSVTAGTLLLDEPIATTLVADAGTLVQDGRRVMFKASSAGRVGGAITMTSTDDIPVIVRYRHILTVVTVVAIPAV